MHPERAGLKDTGVDPVVMALSMQRKLRAAQNTKRFARLGIAALTGTMTPKSFSLSVGDVADFTLTNWDGNSGSATGCSGIATVNVPGETITAIGIGSCTATVKWSNATDTGGFTNYASIVVSASPTPSPTPRPTPTPTPRPTSTPIPTATPATPTPAPTSTGSPLPPSTTGINRWWTYAERPIAGVGKAMINVATGNLIIQSDDVDIPERGIDLAFRRTYNSQSGHDGGNTASLNGSDGSPVSWYGAGWTNTFDAHMAFNASANAMSVYDIDGARYDYSAVVNDPNNPTGWKPPAGMQGNILQWDGGCGYFWKKKSGTVYYFWSPTAPSSCVNGSAYLGRLYEIMGRNHHNNIVLSYAWSANSQDSRNLTAIVAAHSDGQSLTLNFGAAAGGYTVLKSITRPDGNVISYGYDSNGYGTLTIATRPGLATDEASQAHAIPSLSEEYWYYASTHEMQWVAGPRYVWSALNTPGTLEGSQYEFQFDTTTVLGKLTTLSEYGQMNPSPQDGSGRDPIQPGIASTFAKWRDNDFAYNGGSTTFTDTSGHASTWTYDTVGRVTQTQEWPTASYAVVSGASWDPNNNLTTKTDARGNETDYTYDGNGNTTSVVQPTVQGLGRTGRPTARYSYDQYSNLIAYCDPQYVWTSGVTTCNAASGATYYTYDYSDTTEEPNGKLTDSYTPTSYHRHITYDSNDYGLPVLVQGDVIAQNDGTTRQPTQSFGYDGFGNLTSYNKGNGAWTISYDALNRPIERTDPMKISSYTCYNVDGTVAVQRSASQYGVDNGQSCAAVSPAVSSGTWASPTAGVWYVYDADGDAVLEAHHHGCTTIAGCPSEITTKWYDGEDRLVEVRQPQDSNDVTSFPWLTRYIYDIAPNASVSISGGAVGFQAYGNLYKTQECLQASTVVIPAGIGNPLQATPAPISTTPSAPSVTGSCAFSDVRGSTFDGLDRALGKYEVAAGSVPETLSTYDEAGAYGLLTSKANAVGQKDSLTYDALERITNETFSDGTPARSFNYDAAGRKVAFISTLGTEARTYDADGRVQSASDPAGEMDPGTIYYHYYGDGLRSSLDLTVPSQSFVGTNVLTYSYRPDGARSNLTAGIGVGSGKYTWTYDAAGRELQQTDPFISATSVSSPTSHPGNTSYTLGAKIYAYDAYGRVTGVTFPRVLNPVNITYDLEDNEITRNNSGYEMSTRNEVYEGEKQAGFANGAKCGLARVQAYYSSGSCIDDSRSGQVLSETQNNGNVTETQQYTYDAAGRETVDSSSTCFGTGSTTRSYDANNRVTALQITANGTAAMPSSTTCSDYAGGYPINMSYAWGADGRLVTMTSRLVSGGATSISTHWDGDRLLYETSSDGSVAFVVENLSESGGSSLSSMAYTDVADRDWTGTALTDHYGVANGSVISVYFDAISYSAYNPWNTFKAAPQTIPEGAGDDGGTGFPQVVADSLGAPRTDGYSDGFNVFQGVRTYDPFMDQWTTPDAYAGDVHDPMSQKPYMWNNDNPVAYSDPSGYEGSCTGCQGVPITGPPCSASCANAALDVAVLLLGLFIDAPVSARGGEEPEIPASSASSGLSLQKSLASESQLSEAQAGAGRVIAGAGSSRGIDEVSRLVNTYGGKSQDWQKMSSSTYVGKDGTVIETHYYQNTKLGVTVEYKTKLQPKNTKKPEER